MNIFAKKNLSLFVTLLTMAEHSTACETASDQITPASKSSFLPKTIECTNISPIPQGISSCTIVLPGTDAEGDQIYLNEHEQSTHLQVPFPYEISSDNSVYIEDLTNSSGKRKVTDENLEINIFRKDKKPATKATISNVFADLKSRNNLGGRYTMAIDFSSSVATPVTVRYEVCDEDGCR